jgi:hypothetical protein
MQQQLNLGDLPVYNVPLVGTHIFVPENFDERRLLNDYPPKDFTEEFKEEELLWVVSRMVMVPAFNPRAVNEQGYVHLLATLLKQVVPGYRQYLSYLEKAGYVEVDRQYKPGEKARGYRLSEELRFCFMVRCVPISLTSRLYKAMARVEPELEIRLKAREKYHYLTKWFNDNLTLDQEQGERVIHALYNLRKTEREIDALAGWSALLQTLLSTAEELELLRRRYRSSLPIHRYSLTLLTFYHKQWFAKVDSTAGRLHTNLSNLKSELRHCLTYKGRNLACVDVRNSQPYLIVLLLSPRFYQVDTLSPTTSLTLRDGFPAMYETLTKQQDDQPYSSFMLSVSDIVAGADCGSGGTVSLTQESDVITFIQQAQDGTLYEFLESEMVKSGEDRPTDRGALKEIVFQTLFTDNHYVSKPKEIFRTVFPTVYKVLQLFKDGDKAMLAVLLQQIESHIFLDRIAARIAQEQPNLPIYTIHDSIVTLQGYEGYISSVIKEECCMAVGVAPALNVEVYNKESVDAMVDQLVKKTAVAEQERAVWQPYWDELKQSVAPQGVMEHGSPGVPHGV